MSILSREHLKIKPLKGKPHVWDQIRNKWVVLTPEEWVRQLAVHHLIASLKVPKSKINIEKEIVLYNKIKRFDILVYDSANMSPLLIVECKQPNIKIELNTLQQVARYNIVLNATYFLVTNGIEMHYYKKIDNSYILIDQLGNYPFV